MELGEGSGNLDFERMSAFEQRASLRVIDITQRDDFLLTHRSLVSKSDHVFKEGLISQDFAKRIKSRAFEKELGGVGLIPAGMQIWFYVGRALFKVQKAPNSEIFGVLVRPIGSIYTPDGRVIEKPQYRTVPSSVVLMKNRVAPREFVGCTLPEELGSIDKNIRRLVKSMRKTDLALPIYTLVGDLLWPKRMSHEEIVKLKGNTR